MSFTAKLKARDNFWRIGYNCDMENPSLLEVQRFNSKTEATAAAGEKLHGLLAVHKDTPLLLMLSGGSALSILDYVGKQGAGEHLTIAILDERFSQEKEVNNFLQFLKTDFYAFALEAETNFFGSLPRPDETKEMLARRLEKNLRAWRQENPNGLILATLGMGPDGHTAGILPFPEDEKKFDQLFNGQEWVTAYDSAGKSPYPERVTSTLSFLKMIDEGLAFVVGQEKKPKLKAVLAKQEKINQLPALAWHKIKKITVFTDIK